MFQLIVDIYEGRDQIPVVTHIFNGRTMDEAEAIMRAHAGADKFLAAALSVHKTYQGIPLRIKAYRK